jgi:L-seryl-tRNA(Ser) seleniumtransferase
MASDTPGDFSNIPSVERVRRAFGDQYPHEVAVAAARRAIDSARAVVRVGEPSPDLEAIVEDARTFIQDHERSLLRPVINATGVLLHTNLGRAPLGARQLEAVARVAGAYSNLEFDLTTGRRGSRYVHAQRLLTTLTGAEAGLVVNNNAAAVLVTLAALCAGREVIISRGELVEIGGEFRIPEIIEASGARLVEVGTTNRTHLADYEKAITPETAAILKVHPSNYSIVGFASSVDARDIARLTRGRKIHFIHDIGSGLLDDPGDSSEPTVHGTIEDGADVVTFSGDKLLGGPQAGVILGRSEPIAQITGHPLMRAVRVDKMTLAALEETLRMHLDGAEPPLTRMSTATGAEVEVRARRILGALSLTDEVKAEVVPHAAVMGGGSLPGSAIASWAIAISHSTRSAAELDRSLRYGTPPVVARIEDDRLLVDPRTVQAGQEAGLVAALNAAIA